MPPKPEEKEKEKEKEAEKPEPKKGAVICGVRSPGPKYKPRTLVGYKEHCSSKYRNPAFTFGRRQKGWDVCDGPGPKYMLVESRHEGFTIGYAAKGIDSTCGPGPKYLLPDPPKGPVFSMRWRTPYRKGGETPAPYNVKSAVPGPAFSIGLRAGGLRCDGGPGPQSPFNADVIKPRAPMFSMGYRQSGHVTCDSPGPKYYPKVHPPRPIYSFGVKHSECAPPYIVECDEQC